MDDGGVICYFDGFGLVVPVGIEVSTVLVVDGSSIGGAAKSVGSGISNVAGSLGKAMNFGGGFQGGANPQGGMAAAAASNPALRAPAGASGMSPFSMAGMGASAGAMSPLGSFKPREVWVSG